MRKIVVFGLLALVLLSVSCDMEPDAPKSSLASGTYSTAKVVTLSCRKWKAKIYYTLDGSSPMGRNRIEYTGSLTFDYKTSVPMVVLKAAYLDLMGNWSAVAEFDYVFLGPAGGYVFYDKGSYSDGWRYLEAAPADIKDGSTSTFVFGYFRTSSVRGGLLVNGSTTYVEGTSDANDGKSTGKAIGTGKANTTKLVSVMGNAAYSAFEGADTTSKYAAKLCDDYICGGCSDWFLPSKDELALMYTNLQANGIGGFVGSYWSSSEGNENSGSSFYAWYHVFTSGKSPMAAGRYAYNKVRAIREF